MILQIALQQLQNLDQAMNAQRTVHSYEGFFFKKKWSCYNEAQLYVTMQT